jgi:hypothetical protein
MVSRCLFNESRCIVSQDQHPNHNVLDVVFSRLEDRLDELTRRLINLKANQHDREVNDAR